MRATITLLFVKYFYAVFFAIYLVTTAGMALNRAVYVDVSSLSRATLGACALNDSLDYPAVCAQLQPETVSILDCSIGAPCDGMLFVNVSNTLEFCPWVGCGARSAVMFTSVSSLVVGVLIVTLQLLVIVRSGHRMFRWTRALEVSGCAASMLTGCVFVYSAAYYFGHQALGNGDLLLGSLLGAAADLALFPIAALSARRNWQESKDVARALMQLGDD